MEVTEKLVVFPYVFDYLVEGVSKPSINIYSLNANFKQDAAEEKLRNNKVQEVFGKEAKYESTTFNHIKIDHLH